MNGIRDYGLAEGMYCKECGQPKSQRLFGMLTGCETCDDVITQHRCTGRPDLGSLAVGESWECTDCGSVWTASEEEDVCGECGRSGMVKGWACRPGERLDSAPRHMPEPWTPLRNAMRETVKVLSAPPAYSPLGSCHRLESGSMVHVRPGCRCKR